MLKINSDDISALRDTIHTMADAARVETLRYFRQTSIDVENKDTSGFDPVTQADRAAEKAMRDVLSKLRPQDAILGEEYGAQDGSSGLTWVLDPIDGTRAYINGCPTWGVLIGLSTSEGPILGLVDQPYIGERFIGGFGQSELINRFGTTTLKTSQTETLADAKLFTTFPEVGTSQERTGFEVVRDKVKLTRYGMDCYAYALLAGGHTDLVIEAGLNAYDIQGPIAVIEAAGGVVTNWSGDKAHNGGRVVAAANSKLHKAALELLAPFS